MSINKWLIVLLLLGLLAGCGSKEPSAPTLVPTIKQPVSTPTTVLPPTGTPPPPTPTEEPLAALVNGEPILLQDLEREVERAAGAATRQEVLNGMIEMLLEEQAATEAGIVITDEQVDALVQADINARGQEAFQEWLASNDMTEQEYWEASRKELLIRRLHEQIPEELPTTAEHIHARHILVDTKEEAESILAQIESGADFGTLAQTYSLDVTTRDRGGDLGFFPRGLLLVPELEEAAFALAPGQVSGVIHTELLGYHIIQVLERTEREISELDMEMIKANQREAVRLWREQLWENADIELYIDP